MKRYSYCIAVICLFLMVSIPLPLQGENGVYNTFSHTYWCADHAACVHEIGHKLDQENGWPSRSQGFADAVKTFILVQSKQDSPSPLLYKLFAEPDFSMVEMYARIFEWSDGKAENMPVIFQKFYDWPQAARLLRR